MDNTPEEALPPSLRFLKGLVMTLTGVMILGVLVIIFLLVTRLQAQAPKLPEEITLPDGAQVEAVTVTATMFLVVTQEGRILVFDRLTGAQTGEVAVTR